MGFSLLAKDLFQTKDKFGIVVTGILIGEVSVGDNIYILRPEADYRGVVIRIDQNTDGKTYQTDHGVTGSAALHLQMEGRFSIGQYDVVSDVPSQREIDVNVPVVNPYLSGIIAVYRIYKNDDFYMDHFVYALAHGHFLVPIKTMEGKEDDFAFAALPDQNDSSKQKMPLFTDWGQLNRWEGLVQEDEKIKTVILTFPDVAGSLSSGGFDGIVINPFCEQPISVDSSMINSITNLDGYKMEFGN